MTRTKTLNDAEAKKRKNQSNMKSLANNYKQLRVNVKKETYYSWEQYAKTKGMSMYAMIHQFFSEAIEADRFTPDIPYEDSIK